MLAAGLILVPDGPYARDPGALARAHEVANPTSRLLPASTVMPLGEWRLPPPGYVDYCLRFKDRDQGCIQ